MSSSYYTVGAYAQDAFFVTPDGKLMLDPDFDASEDAYSYEIEEYDGGVLFNGDNANDEVGDGDQYAKKYDANGNQLTEGEVYLEESWTLTDGEGNTITLYKVESNGMHSGWVADGPITPGTAYAYSGPNDVTAGNAPRYDSLVGPTDDPDESNEYTGGAYNDDYRTGADHDTVDAGDGNDTVQAGAGDDSVKGGYGNDSLSGGDGNDTLNGEDGDDTIDGGAGNDSIQGGYGDDSISGESGDDFIDGDKGSDHIDGGDGHDSLRGEQGDDTIYGGAGNDSIDGGKDNDSLDGGSGDDTILGGDGDDTIDGGTGSNTVTGGGGDDTFVQSQDGHTFVTDFDIGDADGDGAYNDQLDVSDLRTPEGRPVNAFDVVVTDDGNGNARLTFPEGETIVLEGVSPAQMSSIQQLNAAGIPCFTTGTAIATAGGPRPVEALSPGDLVQTRDNGLRPIRWIGTRAVDRHDLAVNPMLRPVHIAAGTFGNAMPLRLSAQHALALNTGRAQTQLVRAGHLARLNGGAVRVAHGVRAVTYHHLLLDSHDLILAEGVACESFYPGPWGLASIGARATRDLVRLMPDLRNRSVEQCYGPTAHPVARFGRLPPDLRDLAVAS
ncbi:Hint domain-containing protein [Tateyamaria omphalii]|uniref:Hint domain-containing protein n=1 Tax=Tateyamaria omphalii TaxID=299262 RepID=UPI001C995D98|nr:Hint domain-containing protein [Tateyamaria omphalii]MBY5933889.1 Hint domain-containing protein [Tateyamaria omphalii]